MEQECRGCVWISEEIKRRKLLIAQFERSGDSCLAEITNEGIVSLVRDWDSHRNRDHAKDVAVFPLALGRSIKGQQAAEEPTPSPTPSRQ